MIRTKVMVVGERERRPFKNDQKGLMSVIQEINYGVNIPLLYWI